MENARNGNGHRLHLLSLSAKRLSLQKLMIVALLCNLIINLLIVVVRNDSSIRTSLDYTWNYFFGEAWHDSWRPMLTGLEYIHSTREKSVYDALFFEYGLKFQYPPTSLLLLEPLDPHLQDAQTLESLMNTISWLAVLATAIVVALILLEAMKRISPAVVLRDTEPILFFALSIILTLTYYPIVRAYAIGQIQTHLNFLFSASVLAWLKERKGISGMLMGLVAVVKPHYALLLVWGLLKKERRFSAGLTGVIAVFGVLAIVLYGKENSLDYFGVVQYIQQHGESFYANQSFNGLFNRLMENGSILEFNEREFAPFHPFVYSASLVSSLFALGATLFWRPKESMRAPLVDFLIAAVTVTIISPVAWEHHYGILPAVIGAILPLTVSSERGKKSIGLWLLAGGYVLTANLFLFTTSATESPLNIIQSYVLFGALLLLMQLYRLRHSMAVKKKSPTNSKLHPKPHHEPSLAA